MRLIHVLVVGVAVALLFAPTLLADDGQDAAGSADVRGVVVDGDARPVADVEVLIECVPPYVPPRIPSRMSVMEQSTPRPVIGRGRTDEEGRFQATVGTTDCLVLRVEGPDWVGQGTRRPRDSSDVSITVYPARRLDVEVRGASDEPMQASFSEWSVGPAGTSPFGSVFASPRLTDEHGRLSVFVPRAERAHVSVLVPHALLATSEVDLPPEGTLLVLRPLAGPGLVRARVVGHRREAVAGATVMLVVSPWPPDAESSGLPSWLYGQGLVRAATTDEDGWATLDGLPRGTVATVHAFARGHPPGSVQARVPLLDDEPFELEVALPQGHDIAGHVRTLEGKPVAGVDVLAGTDPSSGLGSTTTDADGAFRIPALAAGGYRLRVTHPGSHAVLEEAVQPEHPMGQPAAGQSPAVPFFHVEVPARGAESLEITLRPAAELRVHVTDTDGKPVHVERAGLSGRPQRPGGPFVLLGQSPRDGVPWYEPDITPGLVVFKGLPEQWTFSGSVSVAGHSEELIHAVELGRGTTSVDVHLTVSPRQAVTGRVVDASGRALAGIAVGADYGGTATSDADGRFRIEMQGKHVKRVFVMADVHRERAAHIDLERDVAPEVELVVAEPLRPLSVVVRRADGTPASDLEVRWWVQVPAGSSWDSTRTDARGEARFPHVPAKVDTLFVANAQYQVPPGDLPDVLVVPPEVIETALRVPDHKASLVAFGRVRLPDGRPLPRGWVQLVGGRTRTDRAPVVSGRFALWAWGVVPFIDARLRVTEATDIEGQPLNVVTEDHDLHMDRRWRPVEVQLRAGRTVRGLVLDEAGRLLPGVEVRVQPIENEAPAVHVRGDDPRPPPTPRAAYGSAVDTTDEEGRFEVVGLRPEWDYELSIAAPRGFASPPKRRLTTSLGRAGTEVVVEDLRITLLRWRPLRGRVVDDAGDPVVGATVRLASPRGEPVMPNESQATRTTREDGSFEFASVASDKQLRISVLEARSGSEGTFPSDVDWVRLPDAPVTLVVERHQTLALRVVDESGEPLHRATVTVSGWFLDQPLGQDLRGQTGDDGRVALRPLRRGAYSVSIQLPQRVMWSRTPLPTVLRVDLPHESLDVVVHVPPPDVIRVEGAPGAGALQSATLHVLDPGQATASATHSLRLSANRMSAAAAVGPDNGALLVRFATGAVAWLPAAGAREAPWVAVPEEGHHVEVEVEGADVNLLARVRSGLHVELVRGGFVQRLALDGNTSRLPALPAGTYEVRLVGDLQRMRGTWEVPSEVTLPSDPIVVRYLPP
ncbi:MAG: carboxypeptidase regulatory-like domain-containing protein [Planctomycetota bacterium]